MANEIVVVDRVLDAVANAGRVEPKLAGGAFDIPRVPGQPALRDINAVPSKEVAEKFSTGFNAAYGSEKLLAPGRFAQWRQTLTQAYKSNPKRYATAAAAGLVTIGAGVALHELADVFEENGHERAAAVMRAVADQVGKNIADETGDRSSGSVFGFSVDKAEEFDAIQDAQFALIDGIHDAGLTVAEFTKLRSAIFGVEEHFLGVYHKLFKGKRRN